MLSQARARLQAAETTLDPPPRHPIYTVNTMHPSAPPHEAPAAPARTCAATVLTQLHSGEGRQPIAARASRWRANASFVGTSTAAGDAGSALATPAARDSWAKPDCARTACREGTRQRAGEERRTSVQEGVQGAER